MLSTFHFFFTSIRYPKYLTVVVGVMAAPIKIMCMLGLSLYALNLLRFENGVGCGGAELLQFNQLIIQSENLRVFNLTSLLHLRLTYLYCNQMWIWGLVVGPPLPLHQGLIDVIELDLHYCALTDEGLGESLRYFSAKLSILRMESNQFEGSAQHAENSLDIGEFFPGLSRLQDWVNVVVRQQYYENFGWSI